MKVRELMSWPPITVSADAPVGTVARLMLEHDLSGLPVLDAEGGLVGIVTERDIVAKHARVHTPLYLSILGSVIPIGAHRTDEELRRALAVTAGELMEESPLSVHPDDLVDDIASLMVEEDQNPIPVVQDGELVGVISHSDIIRLLLLEEEDGDDTGT